MSTEKDLIGITAPRDTRRQIEGLVQRFARNLDVYTRPDYKETQVRVERILDPACGSGSFLLGAYQRLLDYHRQWYEEHDPQKQAKGKRQGLAFSGT